MPEKLPPVDALLLVSYGAPENKEDVIPFLENVLQGKGVSRARLEAVAEKYYRLDEQTGRFSPLGDQCRAIMAGVCRELNHLTPSGARVPRVYWGNLFWRPLLEETVAEMARDGIRRATCFATSAFDSLAGNKRYADVLQATRPRIRRAARLPVPILEKAPLPFDHPLFLRAQADRLLEALAWNSLDNLAMRQSDAETLILFTAHSVLQADANRSDYVAQLTQTCGKVAELCGSLPWELAFQSRSGGDPRRWLGPDVADRVRKIRQAGRFKGVVVCPIGFFCENMETVSDLDLDLAATCAEVGLNFVRAKTVGASPEICRMIAECVQQESGEEKRVDSFSEIR